ncbi:chemotaxis protein CheA, partial [bacterium]
QRAEGKKGKPTADWGVRIAELKEKFMAQEPETAKGPGGEFADSPSRCFPAAPSIPTIEKIETVRVNVDLLDSLFDLVGELIITKNRINSIASNIPSDAVQKELKPTLTAMDRMVSELQGNVSAARLVPMSEIVQKFPRMVRDLARDANKEVELVLEGSEIELDKSVLDAISQPLIHLLRNAVDHGIEPAETRQKHNKKHQGTITLKARRTENHVLIDVEDDGGGIDIRRTKEMLVAKGLISPEEIESLEDRDVLDLLSRPGFTTAERVTDLSGRGVGLDVVQTSVKALGGTVEVATKKGKGTRFTLKLPLSTAIMQTLMVGVGDHVFAIPSDLVLEILEINPQDLKEVHNERVLVRRQEVIPFSKLSDVLNIPTREDQEKPLGLIMHIGDRSISLGVDTVVGQAENVIKPFDSIAQQFRGFSGGTILADGQVALLLDVPALLNLEKLTEEVLST